MRKKRSSCRFIVSAWLNLVVCVAFCGSKWHQYYYLGESLVVFTVEARTNHHKGTKLTGYASRKKRHRIPSNNTHVSPKLWLQSSDTEVYYVEVLPDNVKDHDEESASGIIIDLFNSSIAQLSQQKNKTNDTRNSMVGVEGLYGVYEVPSGQIWVWIASSEVVYEAPSFVTQQSKNQSWWQIRKVNELHLTHVPQRSLTHNQQQEEERQVQLLRRSLKDHTFYFCSKTSASTCLIPDLTYNLQQSILQHHNQTTTHHDRHSQKPDSRFFWNEAALESLQNTETGKVLLQYSVPLTSAFIGNRTAQVHHNMTYEEVLISRRSKFRAGTRFTKRGADQTGAVANYAETEQIVFVLDNSKEDRTFRSVSSHVQTRGSIPLRWSSPTDIKTYRPRVMIGTDPIAQARAVRQHLADQAVRYIIPTSNMSHPSMVLVNLIDKKSDQGRLGKAFDAVLKAVLDVYGGVQDSVPCFNAQSIEHLWYDFHAEVKHGRWSRLSSLLKQVRPSALSHGYFSAVVDTDSNSSIPFSATKLQSGVIRTNCMDCLDRTNVVQSIFARFMLFQMLSDLKALSPGHKTVYRKDPLQLPWNNGEVSHRLLWADNADAISRLYAGTPALKGDFTRTGKRTKRGALDDGLNSVQRYYLNNFLDADRQEGIDLMTGYQTFRLLGQNEEPSDYDRMAAATLLHSKFSIEDAARQVLYGVDDNGDSSNESTHSRIKVRSRKNKEFVGRSSTGDFLWLPGDLQSHFRSSIERLPVLSRRFSSTQALKEIDRRSTSSLPWWIDSEDESRSGNVVSVMEKNSMNHAGYIFGAIVAGTQAPLTLATLVLGVTGSVTLGGSSSSRPSQ